MPTLPQPLRVPTVLSLQVGAASAERGQPLPLVATVAANGTPRPMKAASNVGTKNETDNEERSPRTKAGGRAR
ncbi:MAG: hypothetical protein ACYC61_29670 [Isosphaeraceae bacterium]